MANHHCWDWGIRGAGQGGHHEIIDFMMGKEASLFCGIEGAAISGKIPTIDYLYQKGAKDTYWALGLAVAYGNLNTISHLLKLYRYKVATIANIIIQTIINDNVKAFSLLIGELE